MEVKYKDGKITIELSCTEAEIAAAPISKSGKTKMIESTGGFVQVVGAPKGVRIGLNLIGPLEK